MNTVELLNDEDRLIDHVIGELDKKSDLDLAARANTLDHWYFVGCVEVESILCGLMDTDSDECMEWFSTYLAAGENRANPLNRRIAEIFWRARRKVHKYVDLVLALVEINKLRGFNEFVREDQLTIRSFVPKEYWEELGIELRLKGYEVDLNYCIDEDHPFLGMMEFIRVSW